MKRFLDYLLALSGLIFSFPLWTLIAFLVWLEDGWPAFYRQERLGKDGVRFTSFKFRSMVHCAEEEVGPMQAQVQDSRVTKLGEFLRVTAMDELPQLWNILKGDMSFVGPRALRPVEIDAHDNKPRGAWEFEGFMERSKVKPGLTGIAQIVAPRDIPRKEKFKYDIWYVKHNSFLLDIYLLYLSFLITFMGRWEKREDKLSQERLQNVYNLAVSREKKEA